MQHACIPPRKKKTFLGRRSPAREQAIVVPRGTAQHSTERQSMTPCRFLRGARPSFQRQCNFVRAQTQEKHTLVCVGAMRAEGGHSLRSFERCRLLASCMLSSGPIVRAHRQGPSSHCLYYLQVGPMPSSRTCTALMSVCVYTYIYASPDGKFCSIMQ